MGFFQIVLGIVIGIIGFFVLFGGVFTASMIYISNTLLGSVLGLVSFIIGLAMMIFTRKMINES